MNKIVNIILTLAVAVFAVSCESDEDKNAYSGPKEPGDAYFGGGAISEGTPLVAANIDVSKLGVVVGDPTDPAELAPILAERKRKIEEAIANMVFVNGGSFLMGATAEQGSKTHLYERNVHKVTLSDYYMSKYLVTQELYLIVMGGTNQGGFKEGNDMTYPMDNRMFSEMLAFVTQLNDITGLQFSLPTEAQWEFAARGGRKRTGTKYAGSNTIDDVACYWNNSMRALNDTLTKRCPLPVGDKLPNELGLYDMCGNLADACLDWYAPYENIDQIDPTGPVELDKEDVQKKVCRGGGWINDQNSCRISARNAYLVTGRYNYIGFRLVHPKIE